MLDPDHESAIIFGLERFFAAWASSVVTGAWPRRTPPPGFGRPEPRLKVIAVPHPSVPLDLPSLGLVDVTLASIDRPQMDTVESVLRG